jgi:Na+/H+ antiporter NhaD/arsenite permease-like protein
VPDASRLRWLASLAAVALLAPCAAGAAVQAPAVPPVHALGVELSLFSILPFALLLLAIAVLPLVASAWWEHNRNKAVVALVLSLPVVFYLVATFGWLGAHVLGEKVEEYTSFLVLLAALFLISGGIHVRGSLAGTPLVNTGLLGLGTVLASVLGTTGASVLLIRPILRANAKRVRRAHIVIFFIFVVSNCGGLLTPLGDPPLFLGFLKGVPFLWTTSLWREWLFVNGLLLVTFNVWDQRVLAAEELQRKGSQLEEVQRHEPLSIDGGHNFLFLLGVVAVVFCAGQGFGNGGAPWHFGVQEALMVALAALAWGTTRQSTRVANRFTVAPIVEVAVLFAGIFVTMAPALLILNAWGQGGRTVLGSSFGVREPWQYFWCTGALSSFLDNAPTYLTFAATACGMEGIATEGRYLAELIQRSAGAERILQAISAGAVFMGANTYIGNGPNFMVKAIAEESGVRMPSFFGYTAYSGLILLPTFAAVTWLFFA